MADDGKKKHRKRRGRGEGGIRQREDGLWEARVSLGYDAGGKRKRRTVYGKTKQEAQDELRRLQNESAGGIDVAADKLIVAQWLTRWLELVKPTVEPGTYGPYERHVRLHLAPHVGHLRLIKFKAVHVQGLYADLITAGVTAVLQRKIGTTLTVALNQAVKLDLMPSNPAERVRKPLAPKAEVEVFDPDQVAEFLPVAAKDRLYPYYLTALDSGARPGELFALTWDDIDFKSNSISNSKSLEDISGVLRVKPTKTAKNRRRIDLSARTMRVLAAHRKAAQAAGRIGSPVFHDMDGGYLRLSNLSQNSFRPLTRAAGQPDAGLYTLRHTCATLLLLADEPAKVVSERLEVFVHQADAGQSTATSWLQCNNGRRTRWAASWGQGRKKKAK